MKEIGRWAVVWVSKCLHFFFMRGSMNINPVDKSRNRSLCILIRFDEFNDGKATTSQIKNTCWFPLFLFFSLIFMFLATWPWQWKHRVLTARPAREFPLVSFKERAYSWMGWGGVRLSFSLVTFCIKVLIICFFYKTMLHKHNLNVCKCWTLVQKLCLWWNVQGGKGNYGSGWSWSYASSWLQNIAPLGYACSQRQSPSPLLL